MPGLLAQNLLQDGAVETGGWTSVTQPGSLAELQSAEASPFTDKFPASTQSCHLRDGNSIIIEPRIGQLLQSAIGTEQTVEFCVDFRFSDPDSGNQWKFSLMQDDDFGSGEKQVWNLFNTPQGEVKISNTVLPSATLLADFWYQLEVSIDLSGGVGTSSGRILDAQGATLVSWTDVPNKNDLTIGYVGFGDQDGTDTLNDSLWIDNVSLKYPESPPVVNDLPVVSTARALFADDFEAYSEGDLGAQVSEWMIADGPQPSVSTTGGVSDSQRLYIAEATAVARAAELENPGVWTSFYTDPRIIQEQAEPYIPEDTLTAFYFISEQSLKVLNGSTWQTVAIAPPEAGQTLRQINVLTRDDVGLWSLWIDGALVVEDAAVANQPSSGTIELVLERSAESVDQVVISHLTPLPGFDAWRRTYAWVASGDDSETSNPDNDAINNQLEYALGTNPLKADPADYLQLEMVGVTETGTAFDIRHALNPLASDLSLVLKSSTDLEQWDPVPSSGTEVSNDGYQAEIFHELESEEPALFFRLEVE